MDKVAMMNLHDQNSLGGSDQYFQNDPLLTDQYRSILRKDVLDPEKRLMLAMLEDAVKCFQASPDTRQELSRVAEEWIMTEDPEWPFSFENVCEFLDINPLYLRTGLIRWKSAKPQDRVTQIKRLTESSGRRRKR